MFQPKSVEIDVVADSGGQQETVKSIAVAAMVKDEVLVKFIEGTDAKQIEHIQREAGIEMLRAVTPPSLFLMKIVGGSSVEDAIRRLTAYPEVQYAEPNYTRSVKGK